MTFFALFLKDYAKYEFKIIDQITYYFIYSLGVRRNRHVSHINPPQALRELRGLVGSSVLVSLSYALEPKT